MKLRVATALADAELESRVVQVVTSTRDVVLVRRCRDVVELRAVIHSSQVDAVVVDGRLRGIDRDVMNTFLTMGVLVVVVSDSPDDWIAIGAQEVVGRDLGGLAESLRHREVVPEPVPTQARSPEPSGAIIAVWGPPGAPGRSTLAIEMAASITRRNNDVLLVDLDTLGPSIAQQLGLIDDTSGLAAAVRTASQGVLEPDALAGLAVTVPCGPRVLVGLPSTDRWTELRRASTEAVMQCARAMVPWTVVDVGSAIEGEDLEWLDPGSPHRFGAARATLANADAVICVGRPDPIGLTRLLREIPKVQAIAPTAYLRVALNRVRARREGRESAALISDVLGLDPVLLPDDPSNVDAAVRRGRAVSEVSSRSPLVAAIDELVADLAGVLGSYDRAGEQPARADRRLLRGSHRRN
ncbi:MAG TPA: hypothetical protein VFX15_13775 [Actinomycetes bacterium]|nr:hypothetical protein [Actinomycetes bacterium]